MKNRNTTARAWARDRRRGISLVEVMVTIAIVLTLMAILAGGVWQVYRGGQVRITELELGKVAERIQIHQLKSRRPPESLAEVFVGEPVPTDAWGSEIVYVPGEPDWDLVSWGEDRQEGGTGFDADVRYSALRK